MKTATPWRIAWVGIIACFTLLGVAGAQKSAQQEDKDEEPPTANVNFLILKQDNGKPIRNASVIMHSVNSHGQQSRGDLELKTDLEGKASFDGVPYGLLRVQVLASGFQTFGRDYDVKQSDVSVTIKLNRPESQYSIYGNQPAQKNDKPPDPNAKPQ
jgi:hypothetical protein